MERNKVKEETIHYWKKGSRHFCSFEEMRMWLIHSSKCKGREVGAYLACTTNNKETNTSG